MMRANMLRELHRVVAYGRVSAYKNRPAKRLAVMGVVAWANGDVLPNDKTVATYKEQIAEHSRHGDLAVVMEAHRRRRRALHDERTGKPTPFCKVETLRLRDRRWCPAQGIRRVYVKTALTADLLKESEDQGDAFRTLVRREMGKSMTALLKSLRLPVITSKS